MKKWHVFLIGLLLVGLVVGLEEPNLQIGGTGSDDVEKIKDAVDTYSPLDESGKVDYEKYNPFFTKAQGRIDNINLWLDDNVGWMKYIFHMKPAVSLLFFVNVYVILWFFVVVFLNAEGIWFFIEKEKDARIFGACVFIGLLVARLYYGLATIISGWLFYIWDTLLDIAIWVALFGILLCLVLMIFAFPAFRAIVFAFTRYRRAKKEAKEKMESKVTAEAMNTLIKEIGRNN